MGLTTFVKTVFFRIRKDKNSWPPQKKSIEVEVAELKVEKCFRQLVEGVQQPEEDSVPNQIMIRTTQPSFYHRLGIIKFNEDDDDTAEDKENAIFW